MKIAVFLLASAFLVATSKGDIDLERLRHGDIRLYHERLLNVTKKTPFSMTDATEASLERRLQVDGPEMICINEIGPGRFMCYAVDGDTETVTVDPNLPPLYAAHICFDKEVEGTQLNPLNGFCGNECQLEDEYFNVCNSCVWLYNGEYAYDCSNLYPEVECAVKNSRGECGKVDDDVAAQDGDIQCTQLGAFNNDCRANYTVIVDDELPPLVPSHACYTSLVDEFDTSNGECSKACDLYTEDVENPQRCNSCTWLGNGEYAYDCLNLFPDAECAIRNSHGECGQKTFLSWVCFQGIRPDGGLYYNCRARPKEGSRNPAFIFDDVLMREGDIILYCLNYMHDGMHPTDCQEPVCQLVPGIGNLCDSCQILDVEDTTSTQWIAYDCASSVLGSESAISCPRLLPNGTCTDSSAIPLLPFSNFTVGETPDDRAEDGDDKKTWVLNNMDPTVFNVMTDVFDKIVMIIFGIAVAAIYPSFMSWKVFHGLEIPVDTLGDVPSDFWAVVTGYQAWRTSWPTILLVILVVAADFSHSIADSGLDFVTIDESGPEERILLLGLDPNTRSKNRPGQLLGDPPVSRGVWQPTSLWESTDRELQLEEKEKIDLFLEAIALMARGGSPFTQESTLPVRVADIDWNGIEKPDDDFGFVLRYVDGDAKPLIELPAELPLQCAGPAMNISQISLGDPVFEQPVKNLAIIPNCDLTGLRSSGIYPRPSSKKVQILETIGISNNRLVSAHIRLMKGNRSAFFWPATPPSKQLGRDRKDLLGRQFFDMDGIQVGNITISFASVYLASGIEDIDNLVAEGVDKQYFLVAQADEGQCPDRPSLLSSNGTECIIEMILTCDAFEEDSQIRSHEFYGQKIGNSYCSLLSLSIVWGKFPMDAEVAAVTAGVLGLIRPADLDDVFVINTVPAAFFAMATVETRPSIEQKVRPRINFTFAFFMLLPLSTAIAMWIIGCWLQKRSDVNYPDTVWEGMVIGAENPSLVDSKRKHTHDPFPSPPEDVVFKLINKDEDGAYFFDAVEDDGETVRFGIVKKHAKKDEVTA